MPCISITARLITPSNAILNSRPTPCRSPLRDSNGSDDTPEILNHLDPIHNTHDKSMTMYEPTGCPEPSTMERNSRYVKSNPGSMLYLHSTLTRRTQSDGNQEAANTSFMVNLFRGEICPKQVFPYPEAANQQQKEYIKSIADPVYQFLTERYDPAESERLGSPAHAILDELWETGAYGLMAPEEYGGLGLTNVGYATMGDAVGAVDLGLAVVIGAHQSIGWKGILLYGSEDQKRKYLPRVTTGKTMAAFALTEPGAGSDASSIRSRAVKSACGKYYTLNGSKLWITGGGIADIFTVFARTEVTDVKTGQKKDKVTAYIVERDFGGVTSGPPEDKMGIRCSNTTEVYFDDVRIPVENVLGEEGDGFKVAMNILNNGRFGMAATLAGTMRACIAKATEHAKNRIQFGKTIKEFGGVQEKLARMAMLQYVTQSMAYMVAGNMDLGSQNYHLEAAISKVFSSEAAWYVCDEAIQILGGNGYIKSNGLEKILRDLRIYKIFEGANDVLRLFVALVGIQYAGSHMRELQAAFKNPAANLGLIFKEGSRRVARSIGVGRVDIGPFVAEPLRDSGKLCAESIDEFALAVESMLFKYGKRIVDEQFILMRLADSAIDIYAMVNVLSRASRAVDKSLPSADYEVRLASAWCIEASDRVRNNLKRVTKRRYLDNYKTMSDIAQQVCETGGIVQRLPLETN
ncbi:very long-chain specific acyl-CoA dehydrogenase, mitochondrial-like [Sabethes cyaneus]|uniref:very long-chain specific acyl-CoA dehydrogenase, mitochondrial-like n=1 Tax=Sabethes cyaneus TaxID=53552 RepID=UPI00237D78E4|nr:very long-chain specific acyl-CoA dehydrogenase, mitochondrial-like [Sabethes cyaneus]